MRKLIVAAALVVASAMAYGQSAADNPGPGTQQGEHAGQAPSTNPPAGPPQSPGEQPRQLAAPNGPLKSDPNQAPQAKGPDAGGVAAGSDGDRPPPAAAPANWATPLRLYEGSWVVKAEHSDHPQIFSDFCQTSGARFYECEHVVDGETIALLVFVPGDEPGHYYTQSVLPSGTALGRGDLSINADTWVFNTRTVREDGAVEYQRVTRVYGGRDKDTIHYQVERSDDGLHWTTTNSGTEKRRK